MSKLKVVGTVVCLVGISILAVAGVAISEISSLVPIGVGVGSAVGALVAILKKE